MNNKLLMSVIGIALGIILIGSMLAPVISDAQKNLGETVTKTNNVLGNYYCEPTEDMTLTISAEGWIVNDQIITGNYRQIVFADSFVIQTNSPESATYGYIMAKSLSDPIYLYSAEGTSYTVSFEGSKVTVAKTGTPTPLFESEFDWAFMICPPATDGAWGTISRVSGQDIYLLNDSQFYLSGYYYTGANKTFYSYHNGELFTGAYDGACTPDMALAPGTTDIYMLSALEITVGEESFTPYLLLVPLEVTGHEDKGPLYSLVGVIPVIVLVAVLASAGAIIYNRKNE